VSILYLLIPLAVGLMTIAIGFLLWSVRTGQYDDLEGPAYRILMDEEDPMVPDDARSERSSSQPGAHSGGSQVPGDGAAGSGNAARRETK